MVQSVISQRRAYECVVYQCHRVIEEPLGSKFGYDHVSHVS